MMLRRWWWCIIKGLNSKAIPLKGIQKGVNSQAIYFHFFHVSARSMIILLKSFNGYGISLLSFIMEMIEVLYKGERFDNAPSAINYLKREIFRISGAIKWHTLHHGSNGILVKFVHPSTNPGILKLTTEQTSSGSKGDSNSIP
ncbi:hypothetical protein F0562_002029 [Nyssa sinensis]|uniref:Uncharacterized protein n=1 Tax=Nyssa sinensis TaxID=561372 RepID=A0A5J5C4T0_9ASTE|nr:hypothetical protein F0562_002029 [Nyssa sinensis]